MLKEQKTNSSKTAPALTTGDYVGFIKITNR